MLYDFQNILNFSVTFTDLIKNLTVALICGLIIGFFYKKTYSGSGYTNSFLNSLIILTLITSIVIMIIGNNLARAFGLVGAMSIIRFRTAVKDPLDIIFIFFALAIGMAAGVGLLSVAFGGTIFIGLVLLILTKSSIINTSREEYLLQFYCQGENGDDEEAPYLAVIKKYCKTYKLINIKSLGNGDGFELSYYIHLKDINKNAEFIKEFKSTGVNHINLFFDEEHF